MSYFFTFILAFAFSLLLVPAILKLAHKFKWFDEHGNARKIHVGNIPRIGGIGISLSFFIAIISAYFVFSSMGKLALEDWKFWAMLGAGLGLNIVGLIDDFINLKGWIKFIFQIVMAIVVVSAGYYFTVIEIPFKPFSINLGVFGPVITVVWIVGICNAINLLDGIDGLAGGLAFIAASMWAILFFKEGQYLAAMVATAAGGAILGFLFFNFPPANIFMGDSGSLFLGFLLAIMPLMGGAWMEKETGLLSAITICFIPIMDTFAAILRRARARVSFFTPDKWHLHHKLLNMGFSNRQTLAIVFSLCIFQGLAVLSNLYVSELASFLFMITTWVIVGVFFGVLHYFKENNLTIKRSK